MHWVTALHAWAFLCVPAGSFFHAVASPFHLVTTLTLLRKHEPHVLVERSLPVRFHVHGSCAHALRVPGGADLCLRVSNSVARC